VVWVSDQRRSFHPSLQKRWELRSFSMLADPPAAAPGERAPGVLRLAACSRLHAAPSAAIRQTDGGFAAGGVAERAAREFPAFPFTPYAIQQQFMTALYDTLQQGGVGILESPTGTVRIPSRLCAGRPLWPPNPCGACSHARVALLERLMQPRHPMASSV